MTTRPIGGPMAAVPTGNDNRHALTELLASAGFVAAEDEAAELLVRAAGDSSLLDAFVARRLNGEPLAWITGCTTFCGVHLEITPGVYVPRWQTEQLARRATDLMPPTGTAIDLCTGSGAIAKTLLTTHPTSRVVASDLNDQAVACARSNGVETYLGDLFDSFPDALGLQGQVDLVVAVVPYVPTGAMALLQRDTLTFESILSYDGGPDGTTVLARVLAESPGFLRPGGVVLLELGGDEADALAGDLSRLGYVDIVLLLDDEDDVRGLQATWAG